MYIYIYIYVSHCQCHIKFTTEARTNILQNQSQFAKECEKKFSFKMDTADWSKPKKKFFSPALSSLQGAF